MATLVTLFAGPGAPARADANRLPDVMVLHDPTLRPALRPLGATFRTRDGAEVGPFCAPAATIATRITRGERRGPVVAPKPVAQVTAAARLADVAGSDTFRHRIILAGLGTACRPLSDKASEVRPVSADPGTVADAPEDGIPDLRDPGGSAVLDAAASLRRLGLDRPFAGHVAGKVDIGDGAFRSREDIVRHGLVPATYAVAGRFTECLDEPGADCDPSRYAAARSRHATGRNAAASPAFPAFAPASSILAQGGPEMVA